MVNRASTSKRHWRVGNVDKDTSNRFYEMKRKKWNYVHSSRAQGACALMRILNIFMATTYSLGWGEQRQRRGGMTQMVKTPWVSHMTWGYKERQWEWGRKSIQSCKFPGQAKGTSSSANAVRLQTCANLKHVLILFSLISRLETWSVSLQKADHYADSKLCKACSPPLLFFLTHISGWRKAF